MSTDIADKYRPIHHSLAERCAAMGVPVWLFNASGSLIEMPNENTWLSVDCSALKNAAGQIAANALASRQTTAQSHDGTWWVPMIYTQGSQVAAISVAAVLATGPLKKTVLSACGDPRQARHLLTHLPRPRNAQKIVQVIQWTHEDLSSARRHGSMLDEFSEQLSQAFEELNLVFHMSHLLNSTHFPQEIVREMCDELRKSLSFGWVSIHFCTGRDAVPELTNQILSSGNPPCGMSTGISICSEISRQWGESAATKILRPESDPLAQACGAEVLIQPVLHDGRPVALIFAG
ncbi:MAG TPA: hypothetical protein VG722_03460, partial [Tepidisphaeraceae bacterium]|nr:hypothetical protein [Tepidisphaeraceae bacterium]